MTLGNWCFTGLYFNHTPLCGLMAQIIFPDNDASKFRHLSQAPFHINLSFQQ